MTARAAAVTEDIGWAMQRGRRVWTRTATKNQLLSQLDRCFPGLTVVLSNVGHQSPPSVAVDFADQCHAPEIRARYFARELRILSAVLVQANGRGFWCQVSIQARMSDSRAATLVWTPRRISDGSALHSQDRDGRPVRGGSTAS